MEDASNVVLYVGQKLLFPVLYVGRDKGKFACCGYATFL
jgi:hypothetical protein